MAEGNLNPISIGANLGAVSPNIATVDDNAKLMDEDMIPPIVVKQSDIVYPMLSQANFHLRTNVINMF